MPLTYNANKIGTLKIKQQRGNKTATYTIQIRQGNCLAVLVHIRKATPEELKENPAGRYIHTLYSFFADEQHMKNILKNEKSFFGMDKVLKCKLNLYFKEANILLKYFTRTGIKCECYYKETTK